MPLNLKQSNDHEQAQSPRDREKIIFQSAWFTAKRNRALKTHGGKLKIK